MSWISGVRLGCLDFGHASRETCGNLKVIFTPTCSNFYRWSICLRQFMIMLTISSNLSILWTLIQSLWLTFKVCWIRKLSEYCIRCIAFDCWFSERFWRLENGIFVSCCIHSVTPLADHCRTWWSDIYFMQKNADQHFAALELRDAVLRLRRDGAFVAVPLFRVNTEPMGPHPMGTWNSKRSSLPWICSPRFLWNLDTSRNILFSLFIPLHESWRLEVCETKQPRHYFSLLNLNQYPGSPSYKRAGKPAVFASKFLTY